MSEPRSDAELVAKSLAGAPESFAQLVARYKDAVFGVAFHRLGDFEDARDATQDALVKGFTNLSKLREPAAFANWLYAIAEGTALDRARRRKTEVSLDEAAHVTPHTAAPRAEDIEAARTIREALDTLPDASRLAVILHYVNGYSHSEVAQFLGTTEGAVKTRVSRAKSRLREEMAEMVEHRLKKESAVFRYEARDDSGRGIVGTSDAQSAATIRRRLESRGYRVTMMKRDRRRPQDHPDEAVKRVAHTILEQGLKDAAASIKIALTPTRESPVRVRYLIEGKWHEVMAMPHYIWEPLRLKLAEMVGVTLASAFRRQTGTIRFLHEGKTDDLAIAFNRKSIRIDLA